MGKSNYRRIVRDAHHQKSIRDLMHQMIYEENPEELDAYRKLIRSNVSIFRRAYFTGYLFKLLKSGGNELSLGFVSQGKNRKRRGGARATTGARRDGGGERDGRRESSGRRESASRRDGESRRESNSRRRSGSSNSVTKVTAPEQPTAPSVIDGVTSLHINCGKLHGVSEIDLRSLISDRVNESVLEEIESIRVYDRYSFIYINESHAEVVLRALNGHRTSDRTMVVSYSKKYVK